MTKQNLRQKLEQSLANFLETGNMELLNWFMDMDNRYDSSLMNSEILFSKFWNAFVRNGPNNINIFNYLVTHSASNMRNQVGNSFSTLIETKQESQYSTLVTLFLEKYAEWPIEIVRQIENSCLSVALEIGPPHDGLLFNAAFLTMTLSNEQLQQISSILIPRLSSPDVGLRDNALKLLRFISDKSDKIEDMVIQQCIKNTSDLLAANDVNAKALLDYLTTYPEKKLNLVQIEQIIGLIQDQFKLEKPQPIVLLALEFVPNLIDNFNRYLEIIRTMLEFIQIISDDVIKERCKNIFIQFQNKLTSTGKKKVIEVFGEDVFDKKSSNQ